MHAVRASLVPRLPSFSAAGHVQMYMYMWLIASLQRLDMYMYMWLIASLQRLDMYMYMWLIASLDLSQLTARPTAGNVIYRIHKNHVN